MGTWNENTYPSQQVLWERNISPITVATIHYSEIFKVLGYGNKIVDVFAFFYKRSIHSLPYFHVQEKIQLVCGMKNMKWKLLYKYL